jgi:stearoyl-CoA desaturase (delta-9 desaturase)
MDIFIAILFDLHIAAIITSLYFHRGYAHGQLIFTPILEHIFRFLAWVNGWDWPNAQQSYVAQHRKHHLNSDTEQDPHSPYHVGFFGIFDFNHCDPSRPYYLTPEETNHYAPDIKTPDDWLQKKIYDGARIKFNFVLWNNRHCCITFNLSYLILFILFWPFIGILGSIFLVFFHHAISKRYIIPFISNYMFHKGTFNYVKEHIGQDKSKILFPIGIICCGEELHANHHNQPWNPKFSRRWFEYDIGWTYIKILSFFKLLKIRHK